MQNHWTGQEGDIPNYFISISGRWVGKVKGNIHVKYSIIKVIYKNAIFIIYLFLV